MFTKLWTFWCLCTFILFASIFYVVEFVLIALGDIAYVWAHRWPAFCARIIVSSWGIRIRQHNKELLQNLPQCVIVINHRSDLDAMIATGYMPGIFKFIGKKELERYPFIGQLVRQLYITVDRSNNVSKHQSVNNMKKQSNKGANIVVFPEGWSNFSNEYLLEFKRGAFKVALDGKLPVVVCTMIGTHELFPKPKISLRPGTADVYWETIIDTKHLTFEKDSDALQQQVADIFLARLKQAYPNGYHYPADQMDFKTWQAKQLSRK